MINKLAIILFILSVFSNVLINEINLNYIKKINPKNIDANGKSILGGDMVFSVDSEYYKTPVDNYIDGKGWRRSPDIGNGSYFRRMPGYSLLYFFSIKLFGQKNALLFVKLFQILLLAIATIILFKLLLMISKKIWISFFTTAIFSVFPFFSGYSYSLLTEGITPSLTILMLYFTLKNRFTETPKFYNYIFSSVILTWLIFSRPYMAILGLILFVEIFYEYRTHLNFLKQLILKCVLIFSIPLLFISLWTYRNYSITGEFVPLEKAFHPETLDRMKPEFDGMISFTKCWGEDGYFFDTYYHPLLYGALKGDTSVIYVKNTLRSWPSWVVNHFGYEKLYDLVREHQLVVFSQKKYFNEKIAMPSQYLHGQIEIHKKYKKLISDFKSEFPFVYYIQSPLTYLWRNIVHSHTSKLTIFENKNIFTFFTKSMMLLIHIFFYLVLFYNLLFMRFGIDKIIFVFTPLLFLFFFCFIHREIEQRYLLPVLPLLIISLAFIFRSNSIRLFKRYN